MSVNRNFGGGHGDFRRANNDHFTVERTTFDGYNSHRHGNRRPTCCEEFCGRVCATIFGFLLIFGCCIWAFNIENYYVAVEGDIVILEKNAINLRQGNINMGNQGKPIFYTDTLTVNNNKYLIDPALYVARDALKFKRKVEIFQWKEKVRTEKIKNRDGSTTERKHYDYNKIWTKTFIDSSRFYEQNGHYNPQPLVQDLKDFSTEVSGIKVGEFELTKDYLNSLNSWVASQVNQNEVPQGYIAKHGNLYLKQNQYSNHDEPGDMKVSFSVVGGVNQTHTVFGEQDGSYTIPYEGRSGYKYHNIQFGKLAFRDYVKTLKSSNVTTLYVCRFLNWLGMFIGFCCTTSLIRMITSRIPCGGAEVAACLLYTIALACASILWPIVWFIAWNVARPWYAFTALIIGLIGLLAHSGAFNSLLADMQNKDSKKVD